MSTRGNMTEVETGLVEARTAGWPFRSSLELGSLPSAVPRARLHARQVLWEWGLKEVAENAELVVSEMVTNALHASSAITVMGAAAHASMQLEANVRGSLIIQVWDGHPDPPVRAKVDEDAESGRGLLIVESLCDDWGCYWPAGGNGKWVWAAMVK